MGSHSPRSVGKGPSTDVGLPESSCLNISQGIIIRILPRYAVILAEPLAVLWRLTVDRRAAERYGAFHLVDHVAELGQKTVAHQLEDAAAVFSISSSKSSLRCARRRSNVPASSGLHEAAVADDVGRENR